MFASSESYLFTGHGDRAILLWMEFADFHGFNVPADNIPQSRAGLYILVNRVNRKRYVGISQNVRRRIVEHAKGRGCSPVLAKAIAKYGASSFKAFVVLYALGDTTHLPGLEADFIAQTQSITHGYNVQAASGAVGPYGEHFAARMREAFSAPGVRARLSAAQRLARGSPEARAAQSVESRRRDQDAVYREKRTRALRNHNKSPQRRIEMSAMMKAVRSDKTLEQQRIERMRATMATDEFSAKRSSVSKIIQSRSAVRAAQKASFAITAATPEFKAKRSAASKAVHSRPDVKQKQSDSLRAAFADPAARERVAASKRGRIWITDGATNRCIFPVEGTIPDGWWRGKCR